MGDASSGFLSRWARRKAQVRGAADRAGAPAEAAAPGAAPVPATRPVLPALPALQAVPAVPSLPAVAAVAAVEPAPADMPAPTLADVALLTRESDYARFVTAGVDESVKRAAMKKLFTDPHFNVMDGLDTYIADYGVPDPIPLAMLRQMNQSKFLKLFDDDDDDDDAKKNPELPPSAASPTEPANRTDDDPDLRLQQDDAAGRPGPDQGVRA